MPRAVTALPFGTYWCLPVETRAEIYNRLAMDPSLPSLDLDGQDPSHRDPSRSPPSPPPLSFTIRPEVLRMYVAEGPSFCLGRQRYLPWYATL